jgi:hypothetical protein
MAMHWLKAYPVEALLASRFKTNEKTARNHVKKYVLAIQALKVIKVCVLAIFEHMYHVIHSLIVASVDKVAKL